MAASDRSIDDDALATRLPGSAGHRQRPGNRPLGPQSRVFGTLRPRGGQGPRQSPGSPAQLHTDGLRPTRRDATRRPLAAAAAMKLPKFNPYFVLTVVVIACGSIPKGYDEGGFAAASGMRSFLQDFDLIRGRWNGSPAQLTNRKAVITSLGVLGAAIGAIMAVAVTDHIGRLRTWQLFTVLWMTGFFTVTFASGMVGLLMFARIWGGIGAGGLTVVAPLYLTEVARAKSRGMIVSIYMVILLSFLMIGFFINYAVVKTLPESRMQYRIVLGVVQIPVGLSLIASLFLSDTPRWLACKNRPHEALTVLAKLRNSTTDDPAVVAEFNEIQQEIEDKNQALSDTSTWTIIKEVATVPSYRKRFLLGLAMQTFAQWSGGNGITYYIPEIFRLAGITSNRHSLINSGGYGAVKLVFTMIFTWGLIDYFGRRRCFMTGLALQCVTHIYMAVYMALWKESKNEAASEAAVASVFIYAVGWSIGLCTVQYLYGTEILPTRIRGVCYATNMMIHWLFQFAVVRVTPQMFEALNVWGAYVFWACICATGIVVLGLWAPETKGVPMERMAELFSGPWYMGWRAKIDPDSEDERLGSRGSVQVVTRLDDTRNQDVSEKRALG
ncbi:MFS quinate transporter [Purpureocillium lilacinum]|uniref:MFS quinate transporter n=1 Tax=Purpureocillium lilacinum TaxID=33203 RepID=A0A2U3EE92_PURLI|nr:MFS quinate transporter [Purpureocillium lilacinum]